MWNKKQIERLAFEEKLVDKYFSDFNLYHDQNGNPYFSGWTGTNGRRNDYKLKLVLSPFFPDSEPDLFVVSPRPLRMYDGHQLIKSLGTSHYYHLYSNEANDYVKICHTDEWDASCTCVMILLRGVLWVDGYENHLSTGQTIHEYLTKIEETLNI